MAVIAHRVLSDCCAATVQTGGGTYAGHGYCVRCGRQCEPVDYVPAAQLRGAVDLLRWALPYCPEVLPSMEGGEYAERYHEAERLTGGQ